MTTLDPDKLAALHEALGQPDAYRYVHHNYAGRKVSRYGSHSERVNGHDPIEAHPLYGVPAILALVRENERLSLVARRVVEWMRAVDDEEDDLEYLNGDGWNDMRETAEIARAALEASRHD